MQKFFVVLLMASFAWLLGNGSDKAQAAEPKESGGSEISAPHIAAQAAPQLAGDDPKSAIAYQLELLKAGDREKLVLCFTEDQRKRVTAEAVEQGQEQVANVTLDDLVDSITPGVDEGQATAKIEMKNGRTLTTLIHIEGKWLADTIWFR